VTQMLDGVLHPPNLKPDFNTVPVS